MEMKFHGDGGRIARASPGVKVIPGYMKSSGRQTAISTELSGFEEGTA